MEHQHSVLFVDDEVNILKALKRLLRQENMNVLCASRGEEAVGDDSACDRADRSSDRLSHARDDAQSRIGGCPEHSRHPASAICGPVDAGGDPLE